MAVSEIECINWTRSGIRTTQLESELQLESAGVGAAGQCQQATGAEPMAVHSGHGWWLSRRTHARQTGDSARPATLPVTFQLPPPTMRLAAAD